MRRPIISIIVGIFNLLIFINLSLSANDNDNQNIAAIHFAVLGDRTGGAVPGIYEQIVQEIERLRPDFVVTVGDMIEGPENNEDRLNAKWKEYKSIVSQLTMPIYFTPGNNDIENDLMEKYYREYAGEPFYSFDIDDIHFVVIDNSRWQSSEDLSNAELDWLAKDLAANSNARYGIALFHKPFWEKSIVRGEPDTLHSLFKKFGIDAVFTGHYHTYFSGKYDDILYTSVGSSGAGIGQPPATGLKYHFVWVTIDSDGIHIAPVKMGAVRPWDELTADENKFIFPAQENSITFPEPFLINDNMISDNSKFEVNFENFSSEFVLIDTINWIVPSGWNIVPNNVPIDIGTDTNKSYFFDISNNEVMYPSPEIHFKFPYAINKSAPAQAVLPVARQTICFRAGEKPDIDGTLEEAFWQHPVTKLISPSEEEPKTDSTQFYFAYDDRNLYLAAYCKESDMKNITTEVHELDGAVYGDDCVGFILQPDPVKNRNMMYLVYINPLGTIFDQKIEPDKDGYFESDTTWNCQTEAKVIMGEDFWSVELQIPFEQFDNKLQAGQFWGLNFRRKQPRVNDAAQWQIPWRYGPDFLGRLKGQ